MDYKFKKIKPKYVEIQQYFPEHETEMEFPFTIRIIYMEYPDYPYPMVEAYYAELVTEDIGDCESGPLLSSWWGEWKFVMECVNRSADEVLEETINAIKELKGI